MKRVPSWSLACVSPPLGLRVRVFPPRAGLEWTRPSTEASGISAELTSCQLGISFC